MGALFYKFFIFLYTTALRIAAIFNPKAKAFKEGRKNWRQNLLENFKGNKAPVVWFHCASLGEFEQGRPVIEAFKEEFPDFKVLLTFFSPSGYEVRSDYQHADYVFYLPIDTHSNARYFIHIAKPRLVLFVKYEFWHYYTKVLAKNKIPLLSISSIFRPSQIYFQWYGGFYKKILSKVEYFFVQDTSSKKLLKKAGISKVHVSGDTRFDRVWQIFEKRKELPTVSKFKDSRKTMVVGSCWPEDLNTLTSFINESNMKFIIAPHEIEEKFMKQLKNDFIRKTIRYSELDNVDPSEYSILIIDNIGMLSSLYRYGEFAYVGGGFGKGLHNILEPATFGIPIFFGNKNYEKFREANDLINLGGAYAVSGYDEFRFQFRIFSEPKTYDIASQINRDYVKNNVGASESIIKYSKELLE